ncbi:MAG: 50S ribosomal protein L9 [Actinomycetota bacterium]|jgi:large subunit ribosomal protein L9|nr:50S ribosomal protein L9 [Actinomycetota bacterium]
MRVILRADVAKLGRKGDVLEVSDGYGRNYLVPKGLALKATDGAIAQAAAMRRARDVKEARDRAGAEEVARKLTPIVIRIPARAGAEGRLFGSVTATDVAEAVESQTGVTIDRRRVHLDDPIKSLGTHEVAVRLHTDVEARLAVEVVPAST